jgi:hypothetical protein
MQKVPITVLMAIIHLLPLTLEIRRCLLYTDNHFVLQYDPFSWSNSCVLQPQAGRYVPVLTSQWRSLRDPALDSTAGGILCEGPYQSPYRAVDERQAPKLWSTIVCLGLNPQSHGHFRRIIYQLDPVHSRGNPESGSRLTVPPISRQKTGTLGWRYLCQSKGSHRTE